MVSIILAPDSPTRVFVILGDVEGVVQSTDQGDQVGEYSKDFVGSNSATTVGISLGEGIDWVVNVSKYIWGLGC